MAQDIIKDFVKKQTSTVTIGVPKIKPQGEIQEERFEPKPAQVSEPAEEEIKIKGHVGRPKSDIEKVKLSVYVPAEAKEKLIKVQHDNYKQSLNDVLIEAINDIIKKYGR